MKQLLCLSLAIVVVLAAAGCGPKEQEAKTSPEAGAKEQVKPPAQPVERPKPSWGLVTNGGFDTTGVWSTAAARIAGGEAVLQVTGGFQFARVTQTLTGFETGAKYMLSLKARAPKAPGAALVADLSVGGKPKSQLLIPSQELLPTYKAFTKVVTGMAPSDTVVLRIHTSSAQPVTVDEVSIKKM